MLRNFWYPLFFSSELSSDSLKSSKLFGEPLVIFRDSSGTVNTLLDRCPHRSVPLSLGRLVSGKVECAYHGWQFGQAGTCEHIPTHACDEVIPKNANATSRLTVEKDGIIWIWAGLKEEADYSLLPDYPEMRSKEFLITQGSLDLDVDYSLLLENLIDPTHVPFVHRNTLATPDKAQPLSFEVNAMPDGGFRGEYKSTREPALPLPDFFAFEPPCNARAGRNDQSIVRLFHCVPTEKGHSRLLWWMAFKWESLDSSLKEQLKTPEAIEQFKIKVSKSQHQIYAEDLELLRAQQSRIDQGAPAFGCPVKLDLLALKCRKWREEREGVDTWFSGFQKVEQPKRKSVMESLAVN